MIVYIIGSLRNPQIPFVANAIQAVGHEAFADWMSPGEEADQKWEAYEKIRGRTYREAIEGYHAKHVLAFDRFHLDRADAAVLVLPAGKSGHLELGYILGQGKPGYILYDQEPDRWDIMTGLATKRCWSLEDLLTELNTL